jgi:hypothetical protein
LRPEHTKILQAAVEAGGHYSIAGLPLREMILAADAALTLQTACLVKTKIQFVDKQPHVVAVEITAAGRRAAVGACRAVETGSRPHESRLSLQGPAAFAHSQTMPPRWRDPVGAGRIHGGQPEPITSHADQ